MKRLLAITSAVLLASCSGAAENEATTDVVEAEAPAEAMSLNETSWTFTRDGQDIFESIDANGDYIANSGEDHLDHGTYELIDGKQCFTSAMTDEGQVCWAAPPTMAVGETVEITSDAGEVLSVTRVEYEALTM